MGEKVKGHVDVDGGHCECWERIVDSRASRRKERERARTSSALAVEKLNEEGVDSCI